MPLSQRDILKVCEILAEQEQLEVTVRSSFFGACYAFAGALMGGLLGGPVGLGVGSAAGGIYAACKCQGKFKSAVHVIMYEMSERDKQRLVESVADVVRSIDASDVITLITLLNSNKIMRDSVIAILKNTLTSDMGLQLK